MKTCNRTSNGQCHLVLAGGGHSHLAVLKRLGEQPPANTLVTVISRRSTMLYTGMIPGLIAGHYEYNDCTIDLAVLSRYAGAEFIQSELTSINADDQTVAMDNGNRLTYDLLSVNTGGIASIPNHVNDNAAIIPVKPVEQLLAGVEGVEHAIQHSFSTVTITVVGGGAGGIELLLALHTRLTQSASHCHLQWQIITSANDILFDHNHFVRHKLRSLLASRNIRLITNERVNAYNNSYIISDSGNRYYSDFIIWATGVQPPSWINQSGLAMDAYGFIDTNPFLQSSSHHNVFAAGDVAGSLTTPLPKAGVFAVRQGQTLADNLLRIINGADLLKSSTSKRALALISTGDRYAIASRGKIYFSGKWLWLLKDQIDRRFVRRYNWLADHNPNRY